jgi:hypothetical protein
MKSYDAKAALTQLKYEENEAKVLYKNVSVGSALELPDGTIKLVIDTLPVADSHWDGCIILYPRPVS